MESDTERPRGNRVETVEYRDAKQDYAVRLVLRTRHGDPAVEAGDVEELMCNRQSEGRIYQVIFTRGGRRHYHEYPTATMVRCEEDKRKRE